LGFCQIDQEFSLDCPTAVDGKNVTGDHVGKISRELIHAAFAGAVCRPQR